MKIVINKRELDCIIKHLENKDKYSKLRYDIDGRLSSVLAWREEYKDVLPISHESEKKCLSYIQALEDENYEFLYDFIIE